MLVLVREHEDELNRLNVFPVRDHDTGTNMALTLEGVVKAVDASRGRPIRELADAVEDAALLEARGNSGVILGEVLRGLFETWTPLERIGADDLVRGFRAAAERAEEAVIEPVEGTILTVARATADAIEELHGADLAADVAALLAAAAEAAGRAVEATTSQLEVLRRAGVVDAAARGFELCVRAFAATATGQPVPGAARRAPERREMTGEPTGTDDDHGPGRDARAGHGGPAFEVQYLLACGERDAEELERYLAGIGESIAVARSDGRYRFHVHTDHAGAAIEDAIRRGPVSQIQIAYLRGAPASE